MSNNIIIQQANRDNTYTAQKVYGYYAETSNYASSARNSNTLDGHHASDFLGVNDSSSTANLNVWVNKLNSCSFSFSKTATRGSSARLAQTTVLYGGSFDSPRIENISREWKPACTFYPLFKILWSQAIDGFSISNTAEMAFISSDSTTEYTLNQNNTITKFPFLSLYKGPYKIRANTLHNEWEIGNANDAEAYRQSCNFGIKVTSTSYVVTNSRQEINKWINSNQIYETSKNLLESI